MVTDGDLNGSPTRYRTAVQAIESQKLFVINTDPKKNGKARSDPPTHTQAFIMGLPFPNLSAIMPPPTEDIKPQIILTSE